MYSYGIPLLIKSFFLPTNYNTKIWIFISSSPFSFLSFPKNAESSFNAAISAFLSPPVFDQSPPCFQTNASSSSMPQLETFGYLSLFDFKTLDINVAPPHSDLNIKYSEHSCDNNEVLLCSVAAIQQTIISFRQQNHVLTKWVSYEIIHAVCPQLSPSVFPEPKFPMLPLSSGSSSNDKASPKHSCCLFYFRSLSFYVCQKGRDYFVLNMPLLSCLYFCLLDKGIFVPKFDDKCGTIFSRTFKK